MKRTLTALASFLLLLAPLNPAIAADINPMAAQQQPSFLFLVKDAETLITEALIKSGTADSIKVHIEGAHEEDLIASADHPISAQADGLDVDKAHNRWQATLLLKDGSRNLAPIRLAGRYDEMNPVPVLKRTLHTGDVISEDDIEWSQEPITHMRKSTITDVKGLIGKSPKRVISQGRPIREEEIASPAIINKGAHITLRFQSNSLEISTLGEAMDSGARGDVIRVKNIASKTIIEGTVESADRVRVSAPDTNTAEVVQ